MLLEDAASTTFADPGRGTRLASTRARAPVTLDLDHLRVYTLGAADLEREVIGLFVAELPRICAALASAAAAQDWYRAAHTLKGSALAVGARELAAVAVEAEANARAEPAARARSIHAVAVAAAAFHAEAARLGLIA